MPHPKHLLDSRGTAAAYPFGVPPTRAALDAHQSDIYTAAAALVALILAAVVLLWPELPTFESLAVKLGSSAVAVRLYAGLLWAVGLTALGLVAARLHGTLDEAGSEQKAALDAAASHSTEVAGFLAALACLGRGPTRREASRLIGYARIGSARS